MAAKGLNEQDGMMPSASDSTPKGTKTLSPEPGGQMIRSIKGPSIHGSSQKGGDLVNSNGVDSRTTVESE